MHGLAQVRLLRRMLEWQADLLGEESEQAQAGRGASTGSAGEPSGGGAGMLPGAWREASEGCSSTQGAGRQLLQGEAVRVVVMPAGEYAQVARGTTAGDIIRLKVGRCSSSSGIACVARATWKRASLLA